METKDVDTIITEYLSYQDAEIDDEQKQRCREVNFGYFNKSAASYARALIEICKKHKEQAIEKAVDKSQTKVFSTLKRLGISSNA